MWRGNILSSVIMMMIMMLVGIVHDPHSYAGMDMQVNVPQQLASSACNSMRSSESLLRCANLGNISIPSPFVSEKIKACFPESADFVLANCSSTTGQQAFWESFTTALPKQDVQWGLIGPPAVLDFIYSATANRPYLYVNLTWDSHLMLSSSSPPPASDNCRPPRPSTNFSHYFPTSMNLSRLEYAADSRTVVTALSSNTIFLLFNCSKVNGSEIYGMMQPVVRTRSPLCQMYAGTCKSNLTAMFGASPDCHQLEWDDDNQEYPEYFNSPLTSLSLESILDSMSCTHFEVFVVSRSGESDQIAEVGQWLPGVMQLQLISTACDSCRIYSGGACVYDASSHAYQGCKCPNIKGVRFDNSSQPYCGDDLYGEPVPKSIRILIAIGIGIGCVLFIFGLCCCGYRCGKRSMRNRRLRRRALWERQHSVGSNVESIVRELVDDLIGTLSERPVEFSYKSIESATSSFNCLLGKGGFGVVFKGVLAASKNNMHKNNAQEIAVKVLDVRSQHSKKQFLNEVAIIGRVHHINVVRLLGFCVHDEHEMLVYEYVPNGSLDKWVFEPNEEDTKKVIMLDWRQRYSIAVGIARGLSYLHEECRHRIVHCDVKPQNILLDGQMFPKIADFGLARLINRAESRVVTFAKGTPGYMAPELWVGGGIQLSTKADVYSFGMVLLELISGRRNFAHGLPHFPAVAFDRAINECDFDSLLDERLTMSHAERPNVDNIQQKQQDEQQQQQQQIRTAVLVALWCIQHNPADRPRMSAVVQFLEGIATVSEHPPHPTITCASESGSALQHICRSSALSDTNLTPR